VGPSYEADMSQAAIALVKLGVEHVLWVTMREQTDNYRQINDIIRAQARRWPQLQVVDWDAASSPTRIMNSPSSMFRSSALTATVPLGKLSVTLVSSIPATDLVSRKVAWLVERFRRDTCVVTTQRPGGVNRAQGSQSSRASERTQTCSGMSRRPGGNTRDGRCLSDGGAYE
jgi:hypothetical protein